MERNVTAPNQLIYAALLFPDRNNGTRYSAVLVIMDAFTKYITVHLLTSKAANVVNPLMHQYVSWAERQVGRTVDKIVQRQLVDGTNRIIYTVRRVLTDKGGEFVNRDIDDWYATRGIEHVKVGPKSSHLNPCERSHQSLVLMTKAMMHGAGFNRSFCLVPLLTFKYQRRLRGTSTMITQRSLTYSAIRRTKSDARCISHQIV